jgi:WD40 repeat protein
MMIPPRRMGVLLSQAQAFQRQRCIYHNAPHSSMGRVLTGDSLYADHACDTGAFPRVTTLVLDEHEDEVWTLSWSHAGDRLATGGKDKRVIVWRLGVLAIRCSSMPCSLTLRFFRRTQHRLHGNACSNGISEAIHTPSTVSHGHSMTRFSSLRRTTKFVSGTCTFVTPLFSVRTAHLTFRVLQTGHAMQSLEAHTETVSALVWLPDDSGFISAGMDRKIIVWVS